MKKFCECNSNWTSGTSRLQFCGDELQHEHWEIFCKICGFYKWLDPLYENMMFSLRDMNQ